MPSENYLTTREHTYVSGESGYETTKFSAPNIDFINKTDIEVEKILSGATLKVILTKVDETPGDTEYTLDTTESLPIVTLGLALVSSDKLKVRRKTTRGSREVDFVQGSTLTEADLDKATKQGIYLAEEAIDKARDAELEAARIGGSDPVTLPASGGAKNILCGVDSTAWEAITIGQLRTDLDYGTASSATLGSGDGEVPVNPAADASATLGTSAYKDVGTDDGKVPLNSDLGTVRTLDTGVAENNVIKLEADGEIPTGVKGTNLGNLHRPPHITIRHAYVGTGSASTSGSSYWLVGTTDNYRWHARPLNEILVHRINGTVDDLGIELTLPLNEEGALAGGGVGSEINFTEEGTYEVEILSQFYRANAYSTRFVDLDDAVRADQVLIPGTTCHSQNTDATGVSTGSGIIVIGSGGGSGISKERPLIDAVPVGDPPSNQVDADCRRFQLQFACTEDFSADNNLGPAIHYKIEQVGYTGNEGADYKAYITNVFATVQIRKLA